MSPRKSRSRVRLSRKDWVEAAWKVFREGGPGEVSITEIASRLGLTKGSFYWHFEDRDDFRRAMLEHYQETQTDLVIRALRDVSGDPKQLIRALVLFLAKECDLDHEQTVHDWAQQDPEVAEAVAEEQKRRIAFVAGQFRKSGMPARKARFRAEAMVLMLMGLHLTHPGAQSEYLERHVSDIARLYGD